MKNPIGFNQQPLEVNCRIELHPATDRWMQGARFGTVVAFDPAMLDDPYNTFVKVKLDKLRKLEWFRAYNVRRIEP